MLKLLKMEINKWKYIVLNCIFNSINYYIYLKRYFEKCVTNDSSSIFWSTAALMIFFKEFLFVLKFIKCLFVTLVALKLYAGSQLTYYFPHPESNPVVAITYFKGWDDMVISRYLSLYFQSRWMLQPYRRVVVRHSGQTTEGKRAGFNIKALYLE